MKQYFDSDNFEHFLRDSADDFRMYPSRRVWHSLYNDLHPGKKWPSTFILFILVSSILYVGMVNTNEVSMSQAKTGHKVLMTGSGTNGIQTKLDPSKTASLTSLPQSITGNNQYSLTKSTGTIYNSNNRVPSQTISNSSPDALAAAAPTNKQNPGNKNSASIPVTDNEEYLAIVDVNEKTGPASKLHLANDLETDDLFPANFKIESPGITEDKVIAAVKKSGGIKEENMAANLADIAWQENFVFYNKKSSAKWKSRTAFQAYVTPSVGYRNFTRNTEYKMTPASSLVANPVSVSVNENNALRHSSAINLEAGAVMIFGIANRLRIKSGLQFNYTNYLVNAYQLNHPTFTTLLIKDNNNFPELVTKSTTLSNTPGEVSTNLSNKTYQLSIPVGVDYKLAGGNKVNWYIGGSVQPTYITGGRAYVVSSDGKNYVSADDLRRKFNVNGAVETFISFKTVNGVQINLGPQFRYQYFSTYTRKYTYDEKLFNLGIKLGMTRNF